MRVLPRRVVSGACNGRHGLKDLLAAWPSFVVILGLTEAGLTTSLAIIWPGSPLLGSLAVATGIFCNNAWRRSHPGAPCRWG